MYCTIFFFTFFQPIRLTELNKLLRNSTNSTPVKDCLKLADTPENPRGKVRDRWSWKKIRARNKCEPDKAAEWHRASSDSKGNRVLACKKCDHSGSSISLRIVFLALWILNSFNTEHKAALYTYNYLWHIRCDFEGLGDSRVCITEMQYSWQKQCICNNITKNRSHSKDNVIGSNLDVLLPEEKPGAHWIWDWVGLLSIKISNFHTFFKEITSSKSM